MYKSINVLSIDKEKLSKSSFLNVKKILFMLNIVLNESIQERHDYNIKLENYKRQLKKLEDYEQQKELNQFEIEDYQQLKELNQFGIKNINNRITEVDKKISNLKSKKEEIQSIFLNKVAKVIAKSVALTVAMPVSIAAVGAGVATGVSLATTTSFIIAMPFIVTAAAFLVSNPIGWALLAGIGVLAIAAGCYYGYRQTKSTNQKEVLPFKENACSSSNKNRMEISNNILAGNPAM